MVRLNAIPYSSFFYYPSKVEDDADFISGALTKKTNHSLALAQRAYDIMTFEYLNRNMGVPSIVTVDTSWQVQFLTANQSYRPLAQRRITVATGYNDF